MAIGEYCQRDVRTIDVGATLRSAAQRMADEGIGCLVATVGRYPRGVITDRDVALRTLRDGLDPDVTTVGDVLSGDSVVVHASAPLRAATTIMRRRSVRRLPVLDEHDALVGVIAADDLLRLLARELAGVGEVVAAQAPAGTRPVARLGDVPEVE
jgi:CBS domain-containing protein